MTYYKLQIGVSTECSSCRENVDIPGHFHHASAFTHSHLQFIQFLLEGHPEGQTLCTLPHSQFTVSSQHSYTGYHNTHTEAHTHVFTHLHTLTLMCSHVYTHSHIYTWRQHQETEKEEKSKDVSLALEVGNEKKLPKEGSKPAHDRRWLRSRGPPKPGIQ